MKRGISLGLLICAGAADPAAAVEISRWLTVHGLADFRLIQTDRPASGLDGGLGKTRYGGNDQATGTPARLSDLAILAILHPTSEIDVLAHARVESRQQVPVDLIESYVRYRPVSTSRWRWNARIGAFFPPISLENDDIGWTSRYSLTPSAINSWIGEEARTIGGEGGLTWRGNRDRIEASAALFAWNDGFGTLLDFRGWALHDRWAGLFDRSRLPDELGIRTGRPLPVRFDPFREIDGRPGYYASVRWTRWGWGRLTALRYDNRADSTAQAGGQTAWRTRFWSAGLEITPTERLTLLAQAMQGDTRVTPTIAGQSTADYQAFYVLASQRWTVPGWGDWRLTARFDAFGVAETQSNARRVQFSERGKSGLLALSHQPVSWLRLTAEGLHVASRRSQRANVGLPITNHESQLQLNARLQW